MSPNSFEDHDLKIKIRAILVKIGFDTSALNISVHRGVVTIIGTVKEEISSLQIKVIQRIKDDPFMSYDENESSALQNQKNNTADPTSEKLLILESEASKIPGIRNVTLDFYNYKKSGNVWKKKS